MIDYSIMLESNDGQAHIFDIFICPYTEMCNDIIFMGVLCDHVIIVILTLVKLPSKQGYNQPYL